MTLSDEPAVKKMVEELRSKGYDVRILGRRIEIHLSESNVLYAQNKNELSQHLASLINFNQNEKNNNTPIKDINSNPESEFQIDGKYKDPFELAFDEIESNNLKRPLWAKSFAECDGDDKRTRAMYIRLRAAEIQNEFSNIENKNAPSKNDDNTYILNKNESNNKSILKEFENCVKQYYSSNELFFQDGYCFLKEGSSFSVMSIEKFIDKICEKSEYIVDKKEQIVFKINQRSDELLNKTIGHVPNFLQRHWYGLYSLEISFWLNFIGIGFVFSAISNILFLSSNLNLIIGIGIFSFPLAIWQLVGCWRSSEFRREILNNDFWSRITQAFLLLAWILFIASGLFFITVLIDIFRSNGGF